MGGSREIEPAPPPGWSAWAPCRGIGTLSPRVLAEILDGGQSFRWQRLSPSGWIGTWAGHMAALHHRADGTLAWSAPAAIADRLDAALPAYLGTADALASQVDVLPWRGDPHLATCLSTFPGLRLLRQPFGETLLCFLCSATKQIVQIKQMVALLARRFGERIATLDLPAPEAAALEYQLPAWERLASVRESALRECLLGFRARYISETARFLAGKPGWLNETEALPYAQARERLCSLPGVGEKVADCVLLFGAGKHEAFPVDVWMLKAMAARYGLDGWKPPQVAHFGRVHFGREAGLAQQYLFAWERQSGRRRSPEAAAASERTAKS